MMIKVSKKASRRNWDIFAPAFISHSQVWTGNKKIKRFYFFRSILLVYTTAHFTAKAWAWFPITIKIKLILNQPCKWQRDEGKDEERKHRWICIFITVETFVFIKFLLALCSSAPSRMFKSVKWLSSLDFNRKLLNNLYDVIEKRMIK